MTHTHPQAEKLQEQLPSIIASGFREAKGLLQHRDLVSLETREWVLPAKDSTILNWIKTDKERRRVNRQVEVQPNRLIHGDAALVMAGLLNEETAMPSLQGKVDLIYLNKPLLAEDGAQAATALPDASYLVTLMSLLVLANELLSDRGLVCMRVAPHVAHCIKRMIDSVFGHHDSGAHFIGEYLIGALSVDPVPSQQARGTVLLFQKNGAGQIRHHHAAELKQEIVFDGAMSERVRQKMSTIQREKLRDHIVDTSLAHVLEAIILALTKPDAIVADFFAGSGDTAAIAERLARRWIISDIAASACTRLRTRLIACDAEPFLYQAVESSARKATKIVTDDSRNAGDLMQIVLLTYGAQPLPPESDPLRHLGQRSENGKTLVWVDPPDALTDLDSLRKAAAERDRLMGGWDKVVVLGWKFAPSIRASMDMMNDARLDVLAIPERVLDKLAQAAGSAETPAPLLRFANVRDVNFSRD